jgi:hypothetical protein
MAYNQLAGLKPEIWSGQLLQRLNNALVFRSVVNTDYEGEITGFGDVVKINEIGPITIRSYSATSTGSLTVESIQDAQKLLKIDQAHYFAFWVDDQDAAQIKPKVMDAATTEASFGFAKTIDEYIAHLYTDAALVIGGSRAGSTITGQDVTSTNVLKYMSIAQSKMDENNTPYPRWMVVPPWFAQKLTLAKVVHDTSNSGTLATGQIGSGIFGFDVYVSNSIHGGTPAADGAAILAGCRGSISLAVQITKLESARPSTIGGFKTLIKGLLVYGAKVVRPSTLGVLYADYTAEAT